MELASSERETLRERETEPPVRSPVQRTMTPGPSPSSIANKEPQASHT
jgi:hypothetical protein